MKDIKLSLSGSPAGVDEVLVVLAGVHQTIPAAPVVEESAAKMLPPPPPDGSESGAATAKPQTEADKIVQKYDAIGKEQGHTYGGYLSNLPNFNPKPAAAAKPGVSPANGTEATDTETAQDKPIATPREKAPAADAPADLEGSGPPPVLGSRPTPKPVTPKPAAREPAPNTNTGPVLPLGAPRRKPAAPPTDTAPAPQQ
jgi:hypothetical protein